MIATLFMRGERSGGIKVRSANDRQIVAQLRQRLKRRRDLKIRTFLAWRPIVLVGAIHRAARGAMHNLEASQSRLGRGRVGQRS